MKEIMNNMSEYEYFYIQYQGENEYWQKVNKKNQRNKKKLGRRNGWSNHKSEIVTLEIKDVKN